MPGSVSVHSTDAELYEIPATHDINNIKNRTQHDLLPIVLASLALLFTMALGLIWYLPKNQPSEINQPVNDYRDKYFELLIEKEVNDAFDKEKLNFILYKDLVKASDSSHNIYNQPKR